MNYIFYQTKTKFINTGDALINKALLDTLREYGKLQCNCSKEIPQDFIEEIGIKEGEKKGKIEGKKEGILETKKEIIKQMLKYNMSIENIVKITNLSKSEIEKIM